MAIATILIIDIVVVVVVCSGLVEASLVEMPINHIYQLMTILQGNEIMFVCVINHLA